MHKRVLLIGGFNKTRALALSLIEKGCEVTAINDNYHDCKFLSEIESLNVIFGDGTKPYILDEADAENIDIAIALTPRDDNNLVICEMAKKRFRIPKTISLVSDPKKTEFFYLMGIDSVVCAVDMVSNIIEQQTFFEGVTNLLPVNEGEVNLQEIQIDKTSPIVGQTLKDIALPLETIVGCLIRRGRSIVPGGDTVISSGDKLIVFTSSASMLEAFKVLTGKEL